MKELSEELKRYDLIQHQNRGIGSMEQLPEGYWVTYSDYQALESRIKELEEWEGEFVQIIRSPDTEGHMLERLIALWHKIINKP